ncbi:MAG: hypothetical protein NTW46_01665 [Candidatus Nealsonbacteria bacterium]|nr:hypothetical protein [Candidatus Nealsonbacteria bacterium]
MSRKTNKFFIYAPLRRGCLKGTQLLGVNHSYEGGTEKLSMQDLIDFLKEKGINPSKVPLSGGFVTRTWV